MQLSDYPKEYCTIMYSVRDERPDDHHRRKHVRSARPIGAWDPVIA